MSNNKDTTSDPTNKSKLTLDEEHLEKVKKRILEIVYQNLKRRSIFPSNYVIAKEIAEQLLTTMTIIGVVLDEDAKIMNNNFDKTKKWIDSTIEFNKAIREKVIAIEEQVKQVDKRINTIESRQLMIRELLIKNKEVFRKEDYSPWL